MKKLITRGGSYLQEKHLFKSERIRTTIKHVNSQQRKKNRLKLWLFLLSAPSPKGQSQLIVNCGNGISSPGIKTKYVFNNMSLATSLTTMQQ